MADNAGKLWFQDSLNRISVRRAAEKIAQLGRALPCRVVSVSGSIVTVSFEVDAAPYTLPNVRIPKAEGRWVRSPTQVGDLGMTVPADVYLGGISGLGGGTANLRRRANLTALLWVPCGNSEFPAFDQNAAYIGGPNGAVISTENGAASIVANSSGITMSFGGHSVVVNGTGIYLDGVLWDTHAHTYAPGTGTPVDTSGPVSP